MNVSENKSKVSYSLLFLEKTVAVATLYGGGKLLAKILINSSGAINGHIDAGCVSDPNCEQMVIDTVKNLPIIFPAIGIFGNTIKNVVVAWCSKHPDEGTNKSVNATLK